MSKKRTPPDVTCPECGSIHRPGRPMQFHLVDKHGYDTKRAHPIANPRDKQAPGPWKAKRLPPKCRPANPPEDDFDVIDDDDAKAMTDAEAFEKVWDARCDVCGQSPTVRATGMCGPCTWGEAETIGGNW